VPVHIQDRVAKVRKAEQKLVSRGVSFPTVEEIARVAQMGRKEVRKVIESPRHLVISLEQPRESVSEEQEGVFAETIPDETIVSPKEMMERRLLISIFFHKVKDMEKVLSKLRITDKKRDIFRFKYGLTDNSFINRRLQETGDHFGVTRERVRQIVVDVWKRLARRNRWVSEFQTSLEQVTRLGRTEDVSSLIMNSL
jgi:RNA polymerase primary sigma factor